MKVKPLTDDNRQEVTDDYLLNASDKGQTDIETAIGTTAETSIEQMLSTDDPLDKPDFNSVDYINSLFPSEQSLSNIDDVLNRMKQKIRSLREKLWFGKFRFRFNRILGLNLGNSTKR